MSFAQAALFIPGIHGTLQNVPQVAAQVGCVLSEPDFRHYRDQPEPLSLVVDDAYQQDEPIQILCRAGKTPLQGSLLIEDALSRRPVVQHTIKLPPLETITTSFTPLPVGTYRVKLETGEQPLSDVFIVSR